MREGGREGGIRQKEGEGWRGRTKGVRGSR